MTTDEQYDEANRIYAARRSSEFLKLETLYTSVTRKPCQSIGVMEVLELVGRGWTLGRIRRSQA